ncbi:hypothetical protein CJ030_MR0G007564 [Morella rubra]|uniref:Uncharacterized protein n=1 Tax=Morella rubra TaxID=262757 RepID=A0A6A1UIZ2_9ROSI|nr:hypothetical protein CJ030_MR0G007564 [Morella rubra]
MAPTTSSPGSRGVVYGHPSDKEPSSPRNGDHLFAVEEEPTPYEREPRSLRRRGGCEPPSQLPEEGVAESHRAKGSPLLDKEKRI